MNFKPPKILRRLLPSLIWSFDENDSIYITFDDGPNPEVTPWVLEQLSKFNAKATFFCLGKNVEQYPEVYEMIIAHGHAVGNHTYSHQKGWQMRTGRYVEDVDYAANFIHSNLVRPPYGRIKPRQAKVLSQRYHLIMWSVLSKDYSNLITRRFCFRNATHNVKPGSIVVFHDSLKAFSNLKYALPRALKYYQDKGWKMKAIEL